MESTANREARRKGDHRTIGAIALRVVRMAELELENGTLTPARGAEFVRQLVELGNPASIVSFSAQAGRWLDDMEKRTSHSTWKGYRDGIAHAKEALGDKAAGNIAEIKSSDLLGIQAHMMAKGLRGATVNAHSSTLRRIFAAAVAAEILATSPAATLRGVKTGDSRRRAPFTKDEITRLISSAPDDEWKGLIALGATSGLRAGDARKLTSENITGNHITIQTSKTKDSTGVILKIPMHPQVVAYVKGLTGPLFPSLKDLDTSRVANLFKRIMRDAEVSATIELAPGVVGYRSMHSLRHSFATLLADSGVAEDVRRKLTGHASSLVHSKYSHHAQALDDAVATLPEF